MKLSLHYYVLTLGWNSNKLFEAFRDNLGEIQNGGFPPYPTANFSDSGNPAQQEILLRKYYKKVDLFFSIFYDHDPLGLVLVGEKRNRSIFRSVSVHNTKIFGELEGKYEATSAHDLGQIVWPVVRETLSGNRERALKELDAAVSANKVVFGLDIVWRLANSAKGSTLLVEEGFRMKGSIVKTEQSWAILNKVDVREVFDDVVDHVIEKVLKMDGNVIFLTNGTLADFEKIALIRCG